MRHFRWLILLAILAPFSVLAQSNVRASIDSERGELSFNDVKTLEKARSFIRRDSTYYLGHMFQGAFLFFRANDKLGFTKAIAPLDKALELIENDYDRQLRTRSNSYEVYSKVYRFHNDYGLITYLLETCYQNIERPDKAVQVLYHVRDRNFQIEQGINAYNTLAWIYHRNRVYTSKQFPFLRNSVKENVAEASRYLDSALWKLQEDMPMNNGLFDPSFLNRQYLSTYHYKAMIMDYKLEIDSANMYYNALLQSDAYSSNNYAEFKLAMGELDVADEYFREAERREYTAEKNTKEYYYMQGMLSTYRGHPEVSDTLLRKVLVSQGATPGYGWHSIGLARALHYEGLTEESQEKANKASRFQELHIGTTWGPEQYNMAVASLNYVNQVQFKKAYFFENDQWWFWLNPVNWYRWIRYSLEVYHHKTLLASLVAENPERDQVIYSIFSSENLMSFDEVWSVIDGFGNEYFIEKYKKMMATDKRPRLKKYFNYFLGRLYLDEGDEDEARKYFLAVLNDAEADDEYHILLNARVYEGMAKASRGSERDEWIRRVYENFPQLVPFSDLTMRFQLDVSGGDSKAARDILKELKNCDIDIVSSRAPVVTLEFSETPDAVTIRYSVETARGVVPPGLLRIEKKDLPGAGKLLAYRLFAINKQVLEEKPAAVQPSV